MLRCLESPAFSSHRQGAEGQGFKFKRLPNRYEAVREPEFQVVVQPIMRFVPIPTSGSGLLLLGKGPETRSLLTQLGIEPSGALKTPPHTNAHTPPEKHRPPREESRSPVSILPLRTKAVLRGRSPDVSGTFQGKKGSLRKALACPPENGQQCLAQWGHRWGRGGVLPSPLHPFLPGKGIPCMGPDQRVLLSVFPRHEASYLSYVCIRDNLVAIFFDRS